MLNMEDGRPLCKIRGGKYNGKIIYVEPNEKNNKVKNRFESLELNDDSEFVPYPNTTSNREVVYSAGKSGSGKTYYIKQYVVELLKERRKKNRHYGVYIFSPFDEDESLDNDIPDLQRIKIDMDLVDDPINPKDFKDCCVIFDDIDSIKLKSKKETSEIKDSIHTLLLQLLNIGRHYNVDVCVTNHLLYDGHQTKAILNETHKIVFFPHSSSNMSIKRLCEAYGGIEPEVIRKIKKMKTRWCTIHSNYPIIVGTQKKIFNPNADE